jgi:hypothetical protein
MKWLWVLAGILYALVPVDLVPDFAVGLGWIDDLIVLALVYFVVFKGLFQGGDATDGGHRRPEGSARDGNRAAGGGGTGEAPASPHEVLGVSPGASPSEIREAYRRLATQYHPDKVAHLGQELRTLAEEKFKAIQAAYDALRPRGG